MLTLPKLIYKNPEKGKIKGKCVFCAENTEFGFEKEFSGSFTGYTNLYAGDCICEYCNAFFRDQGYRKHSFIATEEDVFFIKRIEITDFLLDPPDPPFFFYVSYTYQKQGWLGNFDKVNYSKKKFFICTENNIVYADIKDTKKYIETAKNLRECKIAKKDMLSGNLSVNSLKKLEEQNKIYLKQKIEEIENRRLWEVIVYGIE